MSLLRKMGSQKPATILHAVPETTDPKPALRSLQQDKAAKPSATAHAAASALAAGTLSTLSPSGSAAKPTSPLPGTELKSPSSSTPAKGGIGTYKHGKIHWRNHDQNPSEYGSDVAMDKHSKPKIQVVIPRATRDRPLPTLPFFGNASKTDVRSTSSEVERRGDVSPPSASSRIRNSIVSPLGQTHSQSSSVGQGQSAGTRNISGSHFSPAGHQKPSPDSGNVSSDSQEDDSSSVYSSHSSQTSAEEEPEPALTRSRKHPITRLSHQRIPAAGDGTRRQIPPSMAPPRQYAHGSSNNQHVRFQPTCEREPIRRRSDGLVRTPTLTRKSSKRKGRLNLAMNPSMAIIYEAINRSAPEEPEEVFSPTLSEAEKDLHQQLTAFIEDTSMGPSMKTPESTASAQSDYSPFKWDNTLSNRNSADREALPSLPGEQRNAPGIVESVASPPPALPRKSSKRASMISNKSRLSQLPSGHSSSQITRGLSQRRNNALTIAIPKYTTTLEGSTLSTGSLSSAGSKHNITPVCAEAVILNILRSLDHLDDLFATAVLNRGFYRVFKRHKLDLIRSTLRKMSPAAWEFREIAFPGHDLLHAEDLEITRPAEEYTPTTYLQLHKKDMHTIRAIKSRIQTSCQSFVRPEISMALSSENPLESARVDDALWRIWTFCKNFGSGKGREEDIVAQIDWLKGGPLVHQTVSFSIISTDYMNDTLVGAPECFAKGNEDGLSAEQLFDMMELWNCLGVLLQGFEGRTALAREAGIYDSTDVRGGDVDGEEMMLGM